ncbi:MAG TPA: hypothetical protein VGH38_07305 [Bryobacteraceae bacterium]
MFGLFKRKRRGSVPFQEQLRVLEKGGIALDSRVHPESLLLSHSREKFENDPYRLLLCVLGGEAEDETQAGEFGYPSNQIWHFDTECIEGHGAYRAIVSRMVTLAQGALPLEQIDDFVDVENGTAWLSFTMDGTAQKWLAKVDNDWVDPAILSRLARLLESRQAGRRFTYIDLQGQDCLIGCATPKQRAWLEESTGLKVEWLK